jgi:hypothetical protein
MAKRKKLKQGNWKSLDEKRFFWNIDWPEDFDDCWIWPQNTKSGYGMFGVGGRKVYAHRYAYQIMNGPIPPGMFVCHKCDNPPCVNPDHLFVGTPKDNVMDMYAKGRSIFQKARAAGITLSRKGRAK